MPHRKSAERPTPPSTAPPPRQRFDAAACRSLAQLTKVLSAEANRVESAWKRSLPKILGRKPDAACLKALAALNLGRNAGLVCHGECDKYFENIEYHSRRLAKFGITADAAAASMESYRAALRERLRPSSETEAALCQLVFQTKFALHHAYYQVRDAEAQAFYDVFRDHLEALTLVELNERVLRTLMRTFRADVGVLLLRGPGSARLTVAARQGLDAKLARAFESSGRRGFAGRIAFAGKPLAVADTSSQSCGISAKVRESLRSVWGAPLTAAGKATGVLVLGFRREYHCLPREMLLLEAIAGRCAQAIEKARLLEDLHAREAQIRALGEHMLKVEEEERRRISRELHDEVGQAMQVIRLYLEMMRSELPDGARAIAPRLSETQRLTEQTIVEMRRLISALSPNVLEQLGLAASVRQFIKLFLGTFKGRVRLRIAPIDRVPQSAEIVMYRLVQECLSNVLKHANARQVSLNIARRNGSLCLSIEDDGVGFDLPAAARKLDSFGLAGMRERVTMLGGSIDIRSAKGKGTRILATLPV